jgi:hypothetical protein
MELLTNEQLLERGTDALVKIGGGMKFAFNKFQQLQQQVRQATDPIMQPIESVVEKVVSAESRLPSSRVAEGAQILAERGLETVGAPTIIAPLLGMVTTGGAIRLKPQQAFKPESTFQALKTSDEFAEFVNQKVRRETRPQLPTEMAEQYRQYGKQMMQEQGSLKGHMKVNYAGQEFGLKSNTQLLASGEPSIKVRSKATRTAQDAKRQQMEVEQTIGTDEFRVGHHRAELDLIHRVMEGLNPSSRKSFVKTVGKQFDNLITGNKTANLIGPSGELPKPIHDAIHTKLREAGLDPRKMDFRNATYKQRLQFMREVDYILRDIDKFIFESMANR